MEFQVDKNRSINLGKRIDLNVENEFDEYKFRYSCSNVYLQNYCGNYINPKSAL